MAEANKVKSNLIYILGILLMCVGMQFANYGTAVCVSGEVTKMDVAQYYVLVTAMGTLGMLLILPIVGKLTAIVGQRNMILIGILVQVSGRVLMMVSGHWISYALSYLLQSIGGGCYISSAYVNMTAAVGPSDRAKYFGYIAVANAVGAILGPILISNVYAAGGIMAKLAYIANLPLTLVGFAMIYKYCPNTKKPGAAKGFDYIGLFLTVIGLACFLLFLNLSGKMFTWFSVPSTILLILGVVALFLLVRRESSIANPAVPIKMFKNKRLTYAFICALVAAAYSSCSASYSVMWIRMNFTSFPGFTFFSGTATLAQQIVILILGMFLGGYIGKKFVKRFRIFGILSMVAAMVATGTLFCLRFTGTAAGGNVASIGNVPLGMIMIYVATAIGGFTSVVSQSTLTAFWQSNTPREDIPSGQALYSVGSTGGSCIFGAVAGVVLGTSGDYSRVFATGFVFATIGLICALVGFKFTKEEIEAANE